MIAVMCLLAGIIIGFVVACILFVGRSAKMPRICDKENQDRE